MRPFMGFSCGLERGGERGGRGWGSAESARPRPAGLAFPADRPILAARKNDDATDQRIARMRFGAVYPLYLAKLERKGRSKAELDQVIGWLTGFDEAQVEGMIAEGVTFERFFQEAEVNPKAGLITG